MKTNMGMADKVIRVIIAAIIILLYATNVICGIWGILLLIFAGIFVVTSIIGYCPLYRPLKISTKKQKQEP